MIPRWIENIYKLYWSGWDVKDIIAFESEDTEAFTLPYKTDDDNVEYSKANHALDKRYELLQDFIDRKARE